MFPFIHVVIGELVEESGSEEEEEVGAEEYEAEQRAKLEEERSAIMNDSTLIAEVSVSQFMAIKWNMKRDEQRFCLKMFCY